MAEEKKETEPAEKKAKCTLFTDVNGCVSMRRFLSFLCCIAGIAIAVLNIFLETDWKMALVLIGLPLIASLIFMFFTSWESIAKVAEAVRK